VALTDDQKAMLRLLAQREQGYEDIAALTGQGVDGVRAKVREALGALDGPQAPADDQKAILRLLAQREEGYEDIAALTGQSIDDVRAKVTLALDALGGGAQSPPAAPPRTPEPAPPTPPPPPTEPKPAEAKPAEPKQTPKRDESKPKPTGSKAALPRLKLPEDRGAALGLGAGVAVVLVLVILLATGALGGGSGDPGTSNSTTASSNSTTSTAGESGSGGQGGSSNAASSPRPTQAVLKPVNGGGASGRALFGKSKKQVVLLVRAEGLEPAPKGRSYTISLAKSPTERLPLIATQVNKEGQISGSFQIAPQVLGLLASGFDEMELSLVSDSELGAALKAARQAKKAPDYGGVVVLSGSVTGAIVEAGEQGQAQP
jgi:hypothetical protein